MCINRFVMFTERYLGTPAIFTFGNINIPAIKEIVFLTFDYKGGVNAAGYNP